MHIVREARYATGHKLFVIFDDGEEKLVDLGSHLDGEIFEPLKDVAYFRRFTVNPDLDTVTWENGADFSPDFLYEIGRPVTDQLAAADRPD